MELVPHDLPVRDHLHQARLHQAIDVRIERAQPRCELGREHVDGALGKIHGRAALVRLEIERASLLT